MKNDVLAMSGLSSGGYAAFVPLLDCRINKRHNYCYSLRWASEDEHPVNFDLGLTTTRVRTIAPCWSTRATCG